MSPEVNKYNHCCEICDRTEGGEVAGGGREERDGQPGGLGRGGVAPPQRLPSGYPQADRPTPLSFKEPSYSVLGA